MVQMEEIKQCEQVARKYGATKIILFGSTLEDMESAHDIDLICSGVSDGDFILMSSEMEELVSVPVDVFSTTPLTSFVDFNLKRGRVLYEQ